MSFPLLLTKHVHTSLEKLGYANVRPVFVPTTQSEHGDFTTRCAFDLARELATPPLKLADLLCQVVGTHPLVEDAKVARGGFVNVTVKRQVWEDALRQALGEGFLYGRHSFGGKHPINIEYVSANPTGPLHVGHTRGAIMGDILANLLEAVGYCVTREYYVNDAGQQIVMLAHSVYNIYLSCFGRAPMFENVYKGEYIEDVGKALAQKEDRRFLDQPESEWLSVVSDFSVAYLMDQVAQDLEKLGIRHQVFTCEKFLHRLQKIEDAVQQLKGKNLVYEGTLERPKSEAAEDWVAEPLLLMRTSDFGDDQDRPLKRAHSDEWTYFAGDLAYHLDKYNRGFSEMINFWGADHASHVVRMKAAVEALTSDKANLEVFICQIVRFFDHGVPVKMSKRSGQFVSVNDILNLIDQETLRFFMASRKLETHLDLDIQDMQAQTKDNPIFYIQYAHARCCSVLRAAKEMFSEPLAMAVLASRDYTSLPSEAFSLVRLLADWPRQVEQSALYREPHLICTFLYRLAQQFHGLWQKGTSMPHLRFLSPDQKEVSMNYAGLLSAVACVIRNGLHLLGIQAKEEMR